MNTERAKQTEEQPPKLGFVCPLKKSEGLSQEMEAYLDLCCTDGCDAACDTCATCDSCDFAFDEHKPTVPLISATSDEKLPSVDLNQQS